MWHEGQEGSPVVVSIIIFLTVCIYCKNSCHCKQSPDQVLLDSRPRIRRRRPQAIKWQGRTNLIRIFKGRLLTDVGELRDDKRTLYHVGC